MIASDPLVDKRVTRGQFRGEFPLRSLDEDRPCCGTFISEAHRETVFAGLSVTMAAKDVAGLIDAKIGIGRIETLPSQLLHPWQETAQEQLHRMVAMHRRRTGHLVVA